MKLVTELIMIIEKEIISKNFSLTSIFKKLKFSINNMYLVTSFALSSKRILIIGKTAKMLNDSNKLAKVVITKKNIKNTLFECLV